MTYAFFFALSFAWQILPPPFPGLEADPPVCKEEGSAHEDSFVSIETHNDIPLPMVEPIRFPSTHYLRLTIFRFDSTVPPPIPTMTMP